MGIVLHFGVKYNPKLTTLLALRTFLAVILLNTYYKCIMLFSSCKKAEIFDFKERSKSIKSCKITFLCNRNEMSNLRLQNNDETGIV